MHLGEPGRDRGQVLATELASPTVALDDSRPYHAPGAGPHGRRQSLAYMYEIPFIFFVEGPPHRAGELAAQRLDQAPMATTAASAMLDEPSPGSAYVKVCHMLPTTMRAGGRHRLIADEEGAVILSMMQVPEA